MVIGYSLCSVIYYCDSGSFLFAAPVRREKKLPAGERQKKRHRLLPGFRHLSYPRSRRRLMPLPVMLPVFRHKKAPSRGALCIQMPWCGTQRVCHIAADLLHPVTFILKTYPASHSDLP